MSSDNVLPCFQTPETSTAATTAAAGINNESGVCEIVYESRSTPLPPTRRTATRQAATAAHVDLGTVRVNAHI